MEEQQYYILHWAEELETIQKKQKEDTLLHEKVGFFILLSIYFAWFYFVKITFVLVLMQKLTPSEKSRLESEIKLKKAKEILFDWTWKMKEMKEVCMSTLQISQIPVKYKVN